MSERILVIQTAFLGDCVLSLPLINTLKKCRRLPIEVVCKKGTEDIFKSSPAVSRTIVFDKRPARGGLKGTLKLCGKLKNRNYWGVYLPQRSFRSGVVSCISGIKKRIGFDRGGAKFFLTQKVPYRWEKHEVQRQLDLARESGCREGGEEFNLKPDLQLQRKWKEKLKGPGKLLGIAPQSRWPTKKWPAESFKCAAEKLAEKNTVVILGQRKQQWKGENIINLTAQTSLKDLIAICCRLELLISNDSGVMHIASAFKVPVVVIYGPTVPELGFTPYGPHEVIQEDLDCRPCGLHGPVKCPRGHFRCMLDIKPGKVFAAAEKMLQKNGQKIQ